MKKFLIPLLLLTLFCSACSSAQKGSKTSTTKTTTKTKKGVHFQKSETLTALLDQAALENKVVFVDFYTSWCLPCKLMDEDVFSDSGVASYMNDNFISYKVNAEEGNGVNLKTVFEVVVYPTLLFLDSKGRVLVRKQGAAYPTELMELGEQAMLLNSQAN